MKQITALLLTRQSSRTKVRSGMPPKQRLVLYSLLKPLGKRGSKDLKIHSR